MSRRRVVHVCSFQSGPDVALGTTYAEVRAAVLEAGRFSVFEATESPRAARLFTQLSKDPTLETFRMEFPWTGVKEKKP